MRWLDELGRAPQLTPVHRLAEEPVRRRNLVHGLRYYKAAVEDVDFSRKTLACKPDVSDVAGMQLSSDPSHSFSVSYDILVLTPGVSVQTFDTPGAPEHALFLRTTNDARIIQQRLLDMLDAASTPGLTRAQQRDILRIVIVGGGAIGIEATAELYDLWDHQMRFLYPHLDIRGGSSDHDKDRHDDGGDDGSSSGGLLSIEIHDVAPVILGTFDDSLAEYARRKLEQRGIEIQTESHITKVESGAMYTEERGDDDPLRFGMLIWATGNKVNPLIEKLETVDKEEKSQRILTDKRLRVRQQGGKGDGDGEVMQDVYAMGDCADIDGYSLPPLAEVAVQKAEYLAKQLNKAGQAGPLVPFKYEQKATTAYLGKRDGVVGGKEEWTGQSAWLAWRSGSIYYWPRSWRRTLMIGISWLFNAVGGRDIARKS